ncbi:hypothetical protein SLS64_004439, partial [Diaporthe eres]
MTEMNGCTARLCQACLRLLRRVNDTISHQGQGLDPSPKHKADHVRSLCYAQSSFREMASAAAAGCRICGMARAQVRAGKFTPLTWSDDDDPWPGDDLMAGHEDGDRMGTGFLLSRPFEEAGGLVCVRFYVDFRNESRALFTTLDEVLWLSPPVRAPTGAQRLKLVSSNLADLERGFLLNDLSQTIREAVQVTREMGVRYLWVDSICIVQDSVDDWESEAVRMSDVYGSSYCTIMATDGRDSDAGLFRPRADSVVRSTWYEVWYEEQTSPTVFMKEMLLEAEGEMSFYTRRLDDAPAAKRAWIFQEHVLSRRLVHFTHDQLMWECQSTVTCESFPEGFSGNGVINDNYLWIPKLKPTGHMTATLKSISAMLRWAT